MRTAGRAQRAANKKAARGSRAAFSKWDDFSGLRRPGSASAAGHCSPCDALCPKPQSDRRELRSCLRGRRPKPCRRLARGADQALVEHGARPVRRKVEVGGADDADVLRLAGSASAGAPLMTAAAARKRSMAILKEVFMSRLLFECDRPISPKTRRRQQRCRAIILQNCRTGPASMFDWNDLRYFLAVAREGSTLAAARVKSQPDHRRSTHRHLGGGARLPDLRKAPGRLRPYARRRRAARTCRGGGKSRNLFADSASSHARELRGNVRVTSEEVYALTPARAALARSAPTASGHPHRAGYRSGDAQPRRR